MKNKLKVAIVFISLTSVIFSGLSIGETPPGIDDIVEKVDNKIKNWHMYYWISLISMIAVGLLGLIITLFQSIDQVKYKIYIICFGTIISACTFLSNSVLKGDYRLYERIELVGISKELELINLVELYKMAANENRDAFLTKINILITQINSLENPQNSVESQLTLSNTEVMKKVESLGFQFIDSAHAAPPSPQIG